MGRYRVNPISVSTFPGQALERVSIEENSREWATRRKLQTAARGRISFDFEPPMELPRESLNQSEAGRPVADRRQVKTWTVILHAQAVGVAFVRQPDADDALCTVAQSVLDCVGEQ